MTAATEQIFSDVILPLPFSEQFELLHKLADALTSAASEPELTNWAKLNQRRGELIHRSVYGQLGEAELRELEMLRARQRLLG